MKETRAAFALLFFIICSPYRLLLPQINVESEVSQSFAVTTCPGSVNGARSTALLPSKQVRVRELVRGKAELEKPYSGTPLLSRGAIVAEGNPPNAWVIQTNIKSLD